MNNLHSKCTAFLQIALHVRGTNPCHNMLHSLREALDVADCCRQRNRSDLATELLDLVETFPLGQHEEIANKVHEQRTLIANRVTTRFDAPMAEPALSENRPPEPGTDARGLVDQRPPPLLIRGWNFASAMTLWATHGFKMRTQAEIDDRLTICQACPHLQNSHCQLCGCACVETNQILNKLAIASEKCPIGKWS